jgi:exosome complex RNA-binding protein Csl4
MDIKEITRAIIHGSPTNADLDGVLEAVKFARARLAQENKRSLRLGSTVAWISPKVGGRVTGTVTKIAQKYVTVNTSRGMWRVPANMLEVENV